MIHSSLSSCILQWNQELKLPSTSPCLQVIQLFSTVQQATYTWLELDIPLKLISLLVLSADKCQTSCCDKKCFQRLAAEPSLPKIQNMESWHGPIHLGHLQQPDGFMSKMPNHHQQVFEGGKQQIQKSKGSAENQEPTHPTSNSSYSESLTPHCNNKASEINACVHSHRRFINCRTRTGNANSKP